MPLVVPLEIAEKIIAEKIFDLSDNRDLTEMERLIGRPERYKILVDETVMLPFRHIRYETLPKKV